MMMVPIQRKFESKFDDSRDFKKLTGDKLVVSSIPFLLSNVKATGPLIRYVNSTGRLKPTFGEVPPPTRKDKR
jgi:hypothetical protein